MSTDTALWPAFTNAVGRALDADERAHPVLERMLDLVEKREANVELTDADLESAIRFCAAIADHTVMAEVNLALGWRPPLAFGPFPRLIPDVYADRAALDAEVEKQRDREIAEPIEWEDTWAERWRP